MVKRVLHIERGKNKLCLCFSITLSSGISCTN